VEVLAHLVVASVFKTRVFVAAKIQENTLFSAENKRFRPHFFQGRNTLKNPPKPCLRVYVHPLIGVGCSCSMKQLNFRCAEKIRVP